LSTLALSSDSGSVGSSRAATLVGFIDVAVLVSALPVFLIAGLPMLGYGVVAAVWIAVRALGLEAAVVLGDDATDPAGEHAVRDVAPAASILHAHPDGTLSSA
jgi:hypothetical protein